MKRLHYRIFCALLAFSLLFSCISAAALEARSFSDWNPGAWYAPAMEWCVKEGHFEGTDRNTIEADRPITRAEFLAVMVRYFHKTETADISFLSDVSPGDWFYHVVAVGYAAGITNGISDNRFAPYQNITREQAFTMFVRALHPIGISPASLSEYRDAAQISSWAFEAVSVTVALNVVEGYADHTLRPGKEITRAEVAQMLYRTHQRNGDEPQNGYTQEEWTLISQMNDTGCITVSVDTELWTSIQTSEAACSISYDASNTTNASISLHLTKANNKDEIELFRTTLRPGDSLNRISLKNLPGRGTYPVLFTVTQETGTKLNFETVLHICYP